MKNTDTIQLNSSLLTHGSRMAKRNTVHKNKSNDQSEWDKNNKTNNNNSSITMILCCLWKKELCTELTRPGRDSNINTPLERFQRRKMRLTFGSEFQQWFSATDATTTNVPWIRNCRQNYKLATSASCCLCTQQTASLFFHEMTSWPPSLSVTSNLKSNSVSQWKCNWRTKGESFSQIWFETTEP